MGRQRSQQWDQTLLKTKMLDSPQAQSNPRTRYTRLALALLHRVAIYFEYFYRPRSLCFPSLLCVDHRDWWVWTSLQHFPLWKPIARRLIAAAWRAPTDGLAVIKGGSSLVALECYVGFKYLPNYLCCEAFTCVLFVRTPSRTRF